MKKTTTAMTKTAMPAMPMSLGALALYLNVGRERMYEMVKRGKIKTIQTSSGMMVAPEECERLRLSLTKIRLPSGRERKVFEEV